ncbi:hypothetical protein PNOK_0049700 [Pyrrhoderma noxium]|uniref:Uncharacterized protein n=1 Tax=Pyrrhoderma noxium TaxID=2282107 RepID=A0A286UV14_9AGAM|nr:hypothetical protein PNOK_0049700 [Pyrrhoderma noxium]
MSSTQPLSLKQERRLIEYVDERFLEITRNYKKRTQLSSTLRTLDLYLSETHTLLSIILQIPPISRSQASLRTTLLLRLTGDALMAIPNYNIQDDIDIDGILRLLLAWLDDLDRGWSAVLRRQVWDPEQRKGYIIPIKSENSDNSVTEISAVNQTERTRLRSLIVSGTAALEEWLDGIRFSSAGSISRRGIPTNDSDEKQMADDSNKDNSSESESDSNQTLVTDSVGGSDAETETGPHASVTSDFESALAQMGLQQSFNELFSRTLSEMGEFSGEILSTGDEATMS